MMKKTWYPLLCGALVASTAMAQSLSDQLKVADCDFRIRYKGKDVTVLDQKITLRAVESLEASAAADGSQPVSAAGYRAYHLEIAYTGHHIDSPYAIRAVEFLNEKKKIIHTMMIADPTRTMAESERGKNLAVRYMAISLEDVPLLLLDDVAILDFKP